MDPLSSVGFSPRAYDIASYRLLPPFTVPDMGEELRQKIRQKERRIRYKRIGRLAAMFAIVLLTGMSFGIWMNADGVYGGKQFSKKKYYDDFITAIDEILNSI